MVSHLPEEEPKGLRAKRLPTASERRKRGVAFCPGRFADMERC